MPCWTSCVVAYGLGNGVRLRPKASVPKMPQIAEAKRKTTPKRKIRCSLDAARPVMPKMAMVKRSRNCPATHQPPRWLKLLLMATAKNLHHRAATRMPSAFDDIALNLSPNQQFQSGEFITQAGQSHEQFRGFRAACVDRQLRRGIGFENEHSARPQTTHRLSVNFAPNRGRQMGKSCDNSSPYSRLDGEISQISKHRLNFNAVCCRESPGFGQTRF